MSRCMLGVHIDTTDFPELGSPFYEPAEKVKVARKDKSDYDGFRQSANIALPTAISDLNVATKGPEGQYSLISSQTADITLPFDDEVPKTYSFLGMDISPDFDAVIKFGSGCVIIGHMCDREKIADGVSPLVRRLSGGETIAKRAFELIERTDEEVFRKIATSLKTGTFYSLLKKFSETDKIVSERYYDDVFTDFIKMIQKDLGADNVPPAGGYQAKFDSIILNLIGDKEGQVAEIQATSIDGDVGEKVAKVFFGALLNYWSYLGRRYSAYKSELAALDLWSDIYKRTIGEKEFNNRFRKCVGVYPIPDTGAVLDRTVSFTGIATNGGVSDDNVIRDRASDQIARLGGMMFSTNVEVFKSLDLADVLRSNIDTTDIEDVYSLSDEEMQALSILDSLRYIDEDAEVCRASYDMDDPEQRGLFVKSAIRSYERNFREFKPVRQYDVTEALAEMVERGDIESNPMVSQQVLTGDPEHDFAVQGDIKTTAIEDMKTLVDLDNLRKVLKLVNKTCTKVLKNFVENT